MTAIRYDVSGKATSLTRLQEKFGKRPGDYLTDVYWFRQNYFTGKLDLWNPDTKSWKQIKPGQEFDWDGDVVRCVSS
jgi:hypothetical protein